MNIVKIVLAAKNAPASAKATAGGETAKPLRTLRQNKMKGKQ